MLRAHHSWPQRARPAKRFAAKSEAPLAEQVQVTSEVAVEPARVEVQPHHSFPKFNTVELVEGQDNAHANLVQSYEKIAEVISETTVEVPDSVNIAVAPVFVKEPVVVEVEDKSTARPELPAGKASGGGASTASSGELLRPAAKQRVEPVEPSLSRSFSKEEYYEQLEYILGFTDKVENGTVIKAEACRELEEKLRDLDTIGCKCEYVDLLRTHCANVLIVVRRIP